MTFEEAVQAAENGDISAINALGDSFRNDSKIEEAIEWYERSANLGDHYGRCMAMMSRSLWALTSEGIDDYDGALENWQISFHFLKSILDDETHSRKLS